MRTSGHLWYVLNTYQSTKYQKSNVLSLTRFENTNCVTMSENRYNSRSDVNIIDCIIFNVGRRFERGFIQSQIWCKNTLKINGNTNKQRCLIDLCTRYHHILIENRILMCVFIIQNDNHGKTLWKAPVAYTICIWFAIEIALYTCRNMCIQPWRCCRCSKLIIAT